MASVAVGVKVLVFVRVGVLAVGDWYCVIIRLVAVEVGVEVMVRV
jgi:hypothetical protein